MEKEHNRKILKEAIRALPAYRPPEGVWEGISRELEQDSGQSLDSAIEELPEYQPPAFVWKNIEQEIKRPEAKIRRLNPVMWMTRVAAVALLIAAGWIWFLLDQPLQNKATISYGEVTVQASPVQLNFEEDEPMIKMVCQAFEDSPLAQQQNNYQSLLRELEELDQAKAEIVTFIEQYGEDAQMVKELADIERARTDVVMKMARFI